MKARTELVLAVFWCGAALGSLAHGGGVGQELGAGIGFGFAVAGLEDLDGDRVLDFAVGAPLWSQEQGQDGRAQGLVLICSGRTKEVLRAVRGEKGLLGFGEELWSVPDVDGDGRRDLVAVHGSWDKPEQRSAWTISSRTGERCAPLEPPAFEGEGLADFDGDGRWDLFVRKRENGAAPALYRVLQGALVELTEMPALVGTTRLRACDGGDHDGDGIGEFWLAVSLVGEQETVVELHCGASGALLERLYPPKEVERADFGRTLLALPDINGDKIPELAVAAPDDPFGSTLWTFSGKDGHLVWKGERAPDEIGRLGVALALTADHDRDGLGDILMGSCDYLWHGEVLPEDSLRVISSRSGRVIWKRSLIEMGGIPGWNSPKIEHANGVHFGSALLLCDDLDGGGRRDYLVSAPLQAGARAMQGVVLLLSSERRACIGTLEPIPWPMPTLMESSTGCMNCRKTLFNTTLSCAQAATRTCFGSRTKVPCRLQRQPQVFCASMTRILTAFPTYSLGTTRRATL